MTGYSGVVAIATPTTPDLPKISGRTWAVGIAAWGALVAGSPLVPLAFAGCIGILFIVVAIVLGVVFYVRALRDTRGGKVGWRGLGWVLLPVGMFFVLCSAIEPSSMFGNDVKLAAISRFQLADPDAPDAIMLRSTYWQLHPLIGHLKWWAGAALLVPCGIRLIGERRSGWLAAALVCSAATGPLVLKIALTLLAAGYREGN